mmetsp:Transcript_40689/g.95068  ORF Transcript_40689/g.95068 Transcript_40689/m.95068 type:complete len:326 (+) Transcript_40689:180-1157(+)
MFGQDALSLAFDEVGPRLLALLLCDLFLHLPRLLRLVHGASVLQQLLHRPPMLQLLHPSLLRVHLLQPLVLGELGEHALPELLLLGRLLVHLLLLHRLLLLVGRHHLQPRPDAPLHALLLRLDVAVLRLLVGQLDLQIQHLLLLLPLPRDLVGDLLEDLLLLGFQGGLLFGPARLALPDGLDVVGDGLVLQPHTLPLRVLPRLALLQVRLHVLPRLFPFLHHQELLLVCFLLDLRDDVVDHLLLSDEFFEGALLRLLLFGDLTIEHGSRGQVVLDLLPALLLFRFLCSDSVGVDLEVHERLHVFVVLRDSLLLINLLRALLGQVR